MRNSIIHSLFILIALAPSFEAVSQEQLPECQVAFISEHYVLNATADTLHLSVDQKNQESFPTEGPTLFMIPPGAEVKVSDIEWAGEFRDPTWSYVFSVSDKSIESSFTLPSNWIFEKSSATIGRYLFTLGN